MSRTTFVALFVSVILLCLSGCGTRLTTVRPQRFTGSSHYHTADITVIDLRRGIALLSAHSPDSVTLHRGAAYSATPSRGTDYNHDAGYKVIVGTTDSEKHEIVIRRCIRGWQVGDVTVGSLNGLLIVDPPSGAAWLLDPYDVSDGIPEASRFRHYNGLRVTLQSDLPKLSPGLTEKMRSVEMLHSNAR
jgi:hypothetical protein